MTDETDETLFEQARSGAEASFAALVQRYERPLFNYLRRFLGDASDAEEVFQETFLKVHLHQDRFRSGARFKPWLYQIATNQARDRLRYRRRRRFVSLFTPAPADAATGLADTLAAPGPTPDAAATEAETRDRLAKAVAALPEKQRAVFLMARYEDMPYGEIAQALGIPEGTVKSRMNKAVKTLLAALDKT